jgi:hypothetical protein
MRLTSLCLAAAAVFRSVSRAQPPVLRYEKQVNYDLDRVKLESIFHHQIFPRLAKSPSCTL